MLEGLIYILIAAYPASNIDNNNIKNSYVLGKYSNLTACKNKIKQKAVYYKTNNARDSRYLFCVELTKPNVDYFWKGSPKPKLVSKRNDNGAWDVVPQKPTRRDTTNDYYGQFEDEDRGIAEVIKID